MNMHLSELKKSTVDYLLTFKIIYVNIMCIFCISDTNWMMAQFSAEKPRFQHMKTLNYTLYFWYNIIYWVEFENAAFANKTSLSKDVRLGEHTFCIT